LRSLLTQDEGKQQADLGASASAVLNGALANNDDFNAIVRLWAYNWRFDEVRQFCTGMLLRNNVILTARHCVENDQADQDYGWPDLSNSVSDVFVSTGLMGYWAGGVNLPPSFAPDGRDLAAFRIIGGLPVATGGRVVTEGFQHPLSHPFAGQWQLIAGYGSITGDNPTNVCKYVSRSTGTPIKGCFDDPFQLSVGIGGTDFLNERVIVTGVTAQGGDSGGPVFAFANVQNVADLPLVAINVFESGCTVPDNCGAPGTNPGAVAMRLMDLQEWVLTR
jgi:hypothetical protein